MKKIEPNKLRNHILDMVYSKKSGHIGGSFSLCELISYLYSEFDIINKDKLILSKGHAVPVLYAVLYEMGVINDLESFREVNSKLQGHPDKNRLKYMHATTGSLGQGLSISIGHALSSKLKGDDKNIFCIVGDGELQEGQIWEGFMLAPKYKLDNLLCFVDRNNCQNDGFVNDILNLGDLVNKIASFYWNVIEIDGHDDEQIKESIDYYHDNKGNGMPTCVILNTIKGKGVSFMQNPEWHSKAPTEEEYVKAKKELDNYESNS